VHCAAHPYFHAYMTTSHTAHTLLIEGPDAIAFAQSQFSNNLAALPDGQWQFSAWLDAQGRVRVLFHLARLDGERLLLLLRGGNADELAAALQRFVFRAKLRLTPTSTAVLGSGPAQALHEVRRDGDIVSLGCGDHALQFGDGMRGDDAWRMPQLRAGWAWLPAGVAGTLLPPALSLYRLRAVALDKGCYPGQEIVARLHYRGGHKRHLHRVTLSRAATDGTMLHVDDRDAVQLLQVVPREQGAEALAVIPDELAGRASPAMSITTNGGLQLHPEARWDD
jgi:folate-binding protein YgfZ